MVEGFVNKVKWIKRSSYGQAGFPLLQRRVRLASGCWATAKQRSETALFPEVCFSCLTGNKRHQVYTDGQHIHLVAWQTPHAVYWVSNSQLEDLNNRQMMAIAESAQQLR